MNKLKKLDSLSPSKAPNVVKFTDHGTNIAEMQPYSAREQLWATRALKAEALLAAQESHHRELKTMTMSQELKRARELERLLVHHQEKHAYLEKLVMVLAGVILILVLVIIYLATHMTRHASKAQRHWLSLPSHFTIPILSPFTSVVEQETSVFSARVIAIISGEREHRELDETYLPCAAVILRTLAPMSKAQLQSRSTCPSASPRREKGTPLLATPSESGLRPSTLWAIPIIWTGVRGLYPRHLVIVLGADHRRGPIRNWIIALRTAA
ncbi:hypothetical protein NMY22_g6679 [Coprinellus aureogranulatus]|nr:hypothetical protein NMY22_g6679 [Coprinellus aureogranulatus]